jgi:exosortase
LLALALHVLGFMVQQARICLVAFAVGLYGIMGLVWGWRWLRASFFPFFLLGFCVPISSPIQGITFPLRMMATEITVFFIHSILGMNVIQDGTRIYDAEGRFSYEIEAACSGLRSLIATVALATIYAFMNFKSPVRRLTMIALAFPLAVAGNVLRLCLIMIVAEAFGQEAGNFVHDNSWLSMLPYVPALVGIGVAGHWLREDRGAKPPAPPAVNLAQEPAA